MEKEYSYDELLEKVVKLEEELVSLRKKISSPVSTTELHFMKRLMRLFPAHRDTARI